MDPFYHNPSPCFPPLQADHGDPISSLTYSTSCCSASSFVHSFNLNHEIEGMDEHQDQVLDDHDYKQEDDQLSLSRDTYNEDHQTQINQSNSFKPLIHESSGHGVVDSGKQCNSGPPAVKWMSSKMRLMKKMLSTVHQTAASSRVFANNEHASRIRQRSPVQDHDESSDNSPNKIRVCSDCNTTKTPLWRSGPQGPKSLCNACGIRQRKARRAMAAAAANGGLLSTSYANSNKLIKEKRHGCTSTSDHKMTQYKKRGKLGSQRSKKKINFDEFKMSLSKSSAFQQVFPQECEIKEAAILLMALSCGLVQG